MKIHHLKQIIGQMTKKITCPQCKKEFKGEDMDMTQVNESGAQFRVTCPHCKTESNVMAQIENPNRITPSQQSPDMKIPIQETRLEKKKRLHEAQKVRTLSDEVKNFGGIDIGELFE